MRLLQVMASNKLGGAEAFFGRLVKSFAKTQRLKQAVLLRQDSPQLPDLQATTTCFLNPFRGTWDLASVHKARCSIRDWHPDILISWMTRATQFTRHKHRRYKHIARLGGFYDLKHYAQCDHWIGNTKGITDYLIRSGLPADRIHHIGNFVQERPGRRLARPDSPLLVTFGRLHQNKAFDTLIQAMSKVPDVTLWIAGTGPEASVLQKLVAELQLTARVKFLGWYPHTEDLLATADIFICPSRHEPLGNVMLEAFAQKTPVIATKSQGAVELIQHEETGLLVPVDTPMALAKSITQLLTSTKAANNMAIAGHDFYHQHFSQPIITQQYFNLFDEVLA